MSSAIERLMGLPGTNAPKRAPLNGETRTSPAFELITLSATPSETGPLNVTVANVLSPPPNQPKKLVGW